MFGVETLAFALALIKCCWVAKCLEKLFYEIAKACGVVVRASDSQLGDPGSNLGSAKSLSMIG